MNRLGNILKAARMFSERRGGFCFRQLPASVGAASSDVPKPRTDPCLFLLCVVFLCSAAGTNPVYRVNGSITVTQYEKENRVFSTNQKHFEGTFSGEYWRITTKHGSGEHFSSPQVAAMLQKIREKQGLTNSQYGPEDLWWVGGTDGVDNFLLGVLGDYEKSVDSRARLGVIPYNDGGSLITPLWLALGSAHNLATNSVHLLPPMWPYRDLNIFRSGYKLSAQWSLFDKSPFLPSLVMFTNRGIEFVTDAGPAGVFTKTNSLPSPYANGFLEAEYRVSQTTNCAGMTFALAFEFTVFRPSKKSGPANVPTTEMRLKYHGELHSVEIVTADAIQFTPAVRSLKPFIVDERFMDGNANFYVHYVLTNGIWPQKNDSILREIVKSTKSTADLRSKSLQAHRLGSSRPRYYVIALLCASSVILVFVLRTINKKQS